MEGYQLVTGPLFRFPILIQRMARSGPLSPPYTDISETGESPAPSNCGLIAGVLELSLIVQRMADKAEKKISGISYIYLEYKSTTSQIWWPRMDSLKSLEMVSHLLKTRYPSIPIGIGDNWGRSFLGIGKVLGTIKVKNQKGGDSDEEKISWRTQPC